jgi:hypothetical protein
MGDSITVPFIVILITPTINTRDVTIGTGMGYITLITVIRIIVTHTNIITHTATTAGMGGTAGTEASGMREDHSAWG